MQKKYKFILIKKVLFFTVVVFLSSYFTVDASSVIVSPASSSYEVGDIVKMKIMVSTAGEMVNAVAVTIDYPSESLVISAITKDGSFLNLWAQEPSYSNSTGTARFEGVALAGFNGSGTAVTVFFKAKKVGPAVVKIVNASVLANDGKGTETFTGSTQGVVTLTASKQVVVDPVPKKESIVSDVETTPNDTSADIVVESVTKPLFTDYPTILTVGEYIVIKGQADPFTTVVLSLIKHTQQDTQIISEPAISYIETDSTGQFSYVSGDRVSEGVYTITAVARNKNGVESEKTDSFTMYTKVNMVDRVGGWLISTLSIIIPIIALVLLLVLVIVRSAQKYRIFRTKMLQELAESEKILNSKISIVENDLEEYAKVLLKTKSRIPLDPTERLLLVQIKKDLLIAQKATVKKIKATAKSI